MPEKEHFGIYRKSKLFPEDQLQMEHSKLLMVPDYVYRPLSRKC
jgi:hypothetical protein